jgi:signal transduction histidine kinase
MPLALAGTAEAIRTIALLAEPLEDPRRSGFMALYQARAVALTAVALGTAWALLHAHRSRRRVAGLAADLGAAPPPGKLREALAAALGDPTVDVLYWRRATGEYVDAAGALRQPAAGATAITRGGRPLALVMHDGAKLDRDELEAVLGPAARLAIENEALRVQVLAQLEDLRASRTRIVAAADDARRRLERDLHDGAQQRLLTAALELRLARERADGEHRRRLAHAGAELEQAFTELRELAHGIFPAALMEAGLEAALATLADTAPVSVNLCEIVENRLRADVEAGAYVAVTEAIHDAAARGAQRVEVTATLEDGDLVLSVDDDGRPRNAALVHVADRVGALGGQLEVGPTILRAEIPCE